MEYLDDPNVPEAVKKQLKEFSDTSEKKPEINSEKVVTPPEEPPETVIPEKEAQPGEEVVKDVETEVVDDVPADIPPEKNPLEPETDIDYKQKYLTLKGKYDAEVPRMTKAIGTKDDVIDFYKRENQGLREQMQNAAKQTLQNSEKFELSPEARQKLADAGYDDPEDLEVLQSIVNNETAPLRQQLTANRNNQPFAGSGCDGILTSKGFVDLRTMRLQPSHEYAMHSYGDFGQTASELYEQAAKRGDFDNAARILADVQSCMINDGLWQGQHPAMNIQEQPSPKPGEQLPAPKSKAKSVLPHNKTITPAPNAPLLNENVLEKASRDFKQGRITYSKFEAIKDKFLQQQSSNKT